MSKDLAAQFQENYLALDAKMDQVLVQHPLERENIFNPYLAQAIMQVLYLFVPSNFKTLFPECNDDERMKLLLEVFGSLQQRAYQFFL